MSDTLRIALVAEGVTDDEVLRAAIDSMLQGKSFDMKLLQPEGSVAFTGGGDAGLLGGGWRGVYKWCLQAVARGDGSMRADPLFRAYDMLILHLDADVAAEDPANYRVNPIAELAGVLPCERPCPHPRETTDRLRGVMLSWLGEADTPPRTVVCTPSKCTEAWVMAIFFPNDREMTRRKWECHPTPEERLAQQPKSVRFSKNRLDYGARSAQIRDGWPSIVGRLTEARRFQDEFMSALETDSK